MARHPETLLILHLRGELDAAARARVEAHLRGCARCRDEAAGLSNAMGAIGRQIAELPTPEWTIYRADLRRKLRDRIAARQDRAESWWRPTLIWGSFAAAGVAALALVTLFALQRPPNVDQLALADVDIGLLRTYPVVEKMDLLENYDVIDHLDELNSTPADTHATRPL